MQASARPLGSLFTAGNGQWQFVARRFAVANANLLVTLAQVDDAATKISNVVSVLDRWFGQHDGFSHGMLCGSWRRGTMVRPAQDIDLLCFPPTELFAKYSAYLANGQSALLQQVRAALMPSYPRTQIRGDGQVVTVEFDSVTVEVAPAFNRFGGGIYICDTNNGGCWKAADTPRLHRGQECSLVVAAIRV